MQLSARRIGGTLAVSEQVSDRVVEAESVRVAVRVRVGVKDAGRARARTPPAHLGASRAGKMIEHKVVTLPYPKRNFGKKVYAGPSIRKLPPEH